MTQAAGVRCTPCPTLAIDLFCGLFGWGERFAAEGYRVVGFDIERRGDVPAGCELVLQDVRTIHGAQLAPLRPDILVSSSPCNEFSYFHRFPWKAPRPLLGIELFWQAWRIQHELCEALGYYVPLIAENVVGAQRWVGPAQARYGSFYLWGDVPALWPFRGENDGLKGFAGRFEDTPAAWFSSKSKERKAWSAEIAKIPRPLAEHIARVFKPEYAAIVSQRDPRIDPVPGDKLRWKGFEILISAVRTGVIQYRTREVGRKTWSALRACRFPTYYRGWAKDADLGERSKT